MEQKIIGINTEFSSLKFKDYDEFSFTSDISLLDYDAVVIGADHIADKYECKPYNNTYRNKRLLSEDASIQIKEDFKRINDQLIELLEQGKNIYILLGKNENCYIYTGEKQFSGTGKNMRTTNIVDEFDVYSFLPIDISVTHILGDKMDVCCESPFSQFFKNTDDLYCYYVYFSSNTLKPLVKIHNSSKMVSAICEYGKGRIVFLPRPYYEDEYDSANYWKKYGKLYLESLFELEVCLSSNLNEFTLPEWTNSFTILNEKEEQNKLEESINKVDKLKEKIEKQRNVIRNIQQYKMLLTATGAQLEEIVKIVLSELGFSLIEPEKGRSDIIAKYKDIDIVAEIKGVSKSAAEKHAAQLEKWVSQFIEENDKEPKALLIVNGFCGIPVQERPISVFPDQMLSYSTVRNHILISTIQLLCLFIDTKLNNDCKEERIEELLSTVGVYQKYENINEFLKIEQ